MTHPLWTSHDAAYATGGTVNARWSASGISIDTRTLREGDLFVALKGPAFDGHDFAAEALQRGAAAVMVGREVESDGAQLLVDDTLQALRDLARAARARSQARIIALTGSVGKTSAKEALRHLLSRQGSTHASAASFNNHWGAPLSLALLPETAKYAVFELGMNHPGEIEPLSLLVRPHVALITNVSAVHLGPLGSLDAIARAKAEIFSGLEPDGIAVIGIYSPDSPIRSRAPERILTFGPSERLLGDDATKDPDAFIETVKLDQDGSDVTACVRGTTVAYRVPLTGEHNAHNSLAVLLAIGAVGGDLRKAVADYATLPPVRGRGDRSQVQVDGSTITLIDETHNASPIAVEAALSALSLMPGRKIVVLGDMLELGPESGMFHQSLAEHVVRAGTELAFLSGSDMAHLHAALPPRLRGGHAGDSTGLLPLVRAALRDGDVVLVKGSRGSRMKVITEGLRQSMDQQAAPEHAL